MSDDSINHLITKYTANMPENMSFSQYMLAHPEVIAISVLLAAAAIGVMIALYLRSRWSKKLLQTTECANRKLEEQLAIVNTLSRDYINVYAVNTGTGIISSVKITGYAAAGLEQDSSKEVLYDEVLTDYINYRVIPEDREYLSEALKWDLVLEKLKTSI